MKREFGYTNNAQLTHLYTLENESIKIEVSDYGATLVSFIDKKRNKDIVIGFEDVQGYINQDCYIGASIGRTANRIEKGVFQLNGQTYTCPINNNGNCNHGGLSGFDKKVWSGMEKDNEVTFRYTSLDKEEGYPGNLFVKVTYRLLDNGIEIISDGTSDQDTLFAYTNHSYFNLNGDLNVLDHELKLNSDKYALSDKNGLALNKIEKVSGTPFDFTTYKKLGEDINLDNEQLKFGNGYDHYFVVDGEGIRKMASLTNGDMTLELESDMPGLQVYTANWLEAKNGKKGVDYIPRCSVALEASYMPNAINYDGVCKPIVKVGSTLKHIIRYTIK